MKKLIIGALLCCPLLPYAQTKRVPDSLMAMPLNQLQQYIVKHPDAEDGLLALKSKFGAYNHTLKDDQPKQVQRMYDELSVRVKNTTEGKTYGTLLQKLVSLMPGEQAPDFTAPDAEGKMIKLSSFRGKYVLLDFWASWCIPCRREFPWLKKVYAQYKSKGFEIIGYSIDNDKSLWLSAIDNEDVPWTHLSLLKGPDDLVSQQYEVHSVPSNWLIDPNGKIIAIDLRGEEVGKKIAGLIN